MAKIDIDGLAAEVMRELEKYQDTTYEAMEKAVKETEKETVEELKDTSPKQTGDYAKNWGAKKNVEFSGSSRFGMTVCVKKPEYRLTHLLEKGHQSRNGGRVPGQPHIKKAEEHAIKKLEERILEGI